MIIVSMQQFMYLSSQLSKAAMLHLRESMCEEHLPKLITSVLKTIC